VAWLVLSWSLAWQRSAWHFWTKVEGSCFGQDAIAWTKWFRQDWRFFLLFLIFELAAPTQLSHTSRPPNLAPSQSEQLQKRPLMTFEDQEKIDVSLERIVSGIER
jgi:hypothetical protein